MIATQNLEQAFRQLTDFWSPRIVGRVNDQLLKVTKLKGELAWHAHEDADELFLVVRGRLKIEFENGAAELGEGEMLTVPRGVRHNPVAEEECWVMLIEPETTLHTGDVVTPRTRSLDEQRT